MKNIYFIIVTLLITIYIIQEVRKKRFSIKESFYWVLSCLIMLILAIFPHSIDALAGFFNISYPPSLFFVICILFLIFMNFRSSKKISSQQEKIIELTEKVAILESVVYEKDKKKKS